MELSVIIPTFNEETRLGPFLRTVVAYLETHYEDEHEIIIVDDGSKDGTVTIAREHLAKKLRDGSARIVSLGRNRGKGAAVRTGMKSAQGIWLLFADADGATPISEVERLRHSVENGADIAIGSRACAGGKRRWTRGRSVAPAPAGETPVWNVRWHRHFAGRIFAFFVRLLTGLRVQDTQCGFKLFTAEAAEQLFERSVVDRFAFDVELLYLAKRLNLTVEEIAVHWHEVEGSKVRLLHDSREMLREVTRLKKRHTAVTAPTPKDSEKLKAKRRA